MEAPSESRRKEDSEFGIPFLFGFVFEFAPKTDLLFKGSMVITKSIVELIKPLPKSSTFPHPNSAMFFSPGGFFNLLKFGFLVKVSL